MKKTAKKIFNIIVDVLVVLVMIVSAFVLILSVTSENSGIPNFFGYAPLSVMSDSMSPTFEEGDLLISKVVEYSSDTPIEIGDVVTYTLRILDDNGLPQEVLNTHRVVEIVNDNSVTYLRTQGDNKITNSEPDEKLVPKDLILAKWTGKKISGIGGFLSFIRTQLGFFLVVLLPMILFFVYEAVRVIMNIIAYNKEKAAEEAREAIANSELTEEQKQRAIEEYLSKQKAKENESEVQTPAADDNSEAE